MVTFFCSIYKIKLCILTDSQYFLSLIKGAPYYFVPEPVNTKSTNFFIYLSQSSKGVVPEETLQESKLVYDHNRIKYYQYDSKTYLCSAQKAFFFCIDSKKRQARGMVYKGIGAITFFFLFVCITEILFRENNIFSICGVSVAKGGKSVILVGPHGSGKTTSALILLKNGFKLLGDDWLFLSHNGLTVKLFCFPLPFRVRNRTIKHFPELRRGKGVPVLKKKVFRIDEIYPDCFIRKAVPKVILFPEVSRARNRLKKMSQRQALIALLPYCFISPFFSRRMLQGNFEAICGLIGQTRSYRISLPGVRESAEELPKILENIL
jgi:hypothetical protein